MLTINFYPESDKKGFIKASKEYQKIWQEEGENMIKTIEKISGLKFKTKVINAVVFHGVSYSLPLKLNDSFDLDQKRAVLVHELCHRLLVDINFHLPRKLDREKHTYEIHKVIYLILYDIWVALYGDIFAQKQMKNEKSYNHKSHVDAWNWAYLLTKKEREKEFKKICGPDGT